MGIPGCQPFQWQTCPLPSFSVSTADRQNWNHSASSCYCLTSVWLRQRARLAIVQDLLWSCALSRVSRHVNFCHGSHRRDLVDALTLVPVQVCSGHGCTKCSVTLTLTEQLLNAESGIRNPITSGAFYWILILKNSIARVNVNSSLKSLSVSKNPNIFQNFHRSQLSVLLPSQILCFVTSPQNTG